MSLAAPARPSFLLEHVRLCLKHVGDTYSVCSPPPCGEGLGVGVARFFAGGATEISLPPPHPSPARGGGADRVWCAGDSHRPFRSRGGLAARRLVCRPATREAVQRR